MRSLGARSRPYVMNISGRLIDSDKKWDQSVTNYLITQRNDSWERLAVPEWIKSCVPRV